MPQQLVLEVSNPAILPSLRKVLRSIGGVRLLRSAKPYSTTVSPSGDKWFDEPANIKAIRQGEEDLHQGRTRQMSMDDIKANGVAR